jgi:tetratricopeptide (TPR) repeat protein
LGVGLFVASWWFVQFAPARAEALRESVAYAPPEEGIRLLSSAIQWQPRDPALWESRGFLRYSAGIPDARGDLEKALSLNPHSSRLHESLGLLLWTMGNKVEAMALQEKAITLHPADPDRRITMAGYLFDEGRVDEAIGMIESTTELLWTRTGGQAARDQLLARIAVLQSASHEGSGDEPSPTE